ncbi:MAG TPA: DMT family transporter [Anaerolineae bacterium]|nr:DMT family transporter [Anaerolineae bacterium]
MELPLESQTTTPDRAHLNSGYTLGLIGVASWSTTAIFISYLLKNFPLQPLTLAFWRDLFVVGALVLLLAIFRRTALHVDRGQRKFLVLYGASLTLMNISWTLSVALNGAAVSTVMVYASPGITAIAAHFFFKERLSPIRVLAFLGALLGAFFVAKANDPTQWNGNAAGIVIGVLSAFGFAFYSLMGKAVSQRRINSWTATLNAFGVATIFLLPTALITLALGQVSAPIGTAAQYNLFSLGTQWNGWLILFILAIGPTLGGYGFYTASLGYLPAGTANLLATLEPVLTTILAYLLLNESLSPGQFIGAGLIVLSVISLRLEER